MSRITDNPRLLAGAVLLAIVAAGAGYGVAQLQPRRGAVSSPAVSPAPNRKILYWYDPMVPNQHFPKPGLSPMGMQMVPKYADQAGPMSSGVHVDPADVQNLGVRTAVAEPGVLPMDVTAPGAVDFNERNVAIVQPRAAGFVQRVYQRAPGDIVRAGTPIADLLIPEWGGAQTEFLAVRRIGDPRLVAAARQRLYLLGMPEALIRSVERQGRPKPTFTVTTPVGGVIQKLDVRPGMSVVAGETLAEVNNLSSVWVTAAVPEAQTGEVREGQSATISLDAYPGQSFQGRIQALLPQVTETSRTLQARIELRNPGLRLRPGMFAKVGFTGSAQPALLVPSEAVIRTGTRNLVMLARLGGRYQPAEVRLGREAQGKTEILAGLEAGERVVVSGQFLLDSEASLTGLQARPIGAGAGMAPMAAPSTPRPSHVAGRVAETTGRVETVSPTSITISHQPVPSIGWPAMTMTFRVPDPALTRGVKVGDQVRFGFDQPAEGPTLRSLTKIAGAGR